MTGDQEMALAAKLPEWGVLLFLLAREVLAGWNSRKSQGERIGEIRRDVDQIAADLNVKLKRRGRDD